MLEEPLPQVMIQAPHRTKGKQRLGRSWRKSNLGKRRIIREARIKRPKGAQFLHDFSKRTLERRASHIPEMLEAREQGKVAYMIMVMDRLIIRDKLPRRDKDVVNIEDEVFVSQRQRK